MRAHVTVETADAALLARIEAALVGIEGLEVVIPDPTGREQVLGVLADASFRTVFQPVVDLRSGHVVALEALARFDAEPARRPDAWLALAERHGLRVTLEHALVRTAVQTFAGVVPEPICLGVNVSPAALLHPAFAATLEGLPVDRVWVEITDHAQVEDYEELAESLAPLRGQGLQVAVDDSGHGLGSLHQVARLAPSAIKLNRSLTRNVDRDPTKHALADALVSVGSHLGARVVAEGLETEGELHALRSLGAGLGQGYLLARPAPIEECRLVPFEVPVAPVAGSAAATAYELPARATEDLREATRQVLRAIDARLPGASACLGQLDYAARRFTIVAAQGPYALHGGMEPGRSMPLEDSLSFHVAAGRAPRLCGDLAGDPGLAGVPGVAGGDLTSFVGVPIELDDGTRVAALSVVSRDPDAFTAADLRALEGMADALRGVLLHETRDMDRGQLMRHVRRLARTDGLTDLLNPCGLDAALREELGRFSSRGTRFVVAAEITDIESIYARYGHAVRDLVVKDVALALRAGSEGMDLVGRVGDATFLALLVGRRDDGGARAYCHSVGARLAELAERREITPSVRVGVAAVEDVRDADAAWAAATRETWTLQAPGALAR
jgi:diguanylate cyclase (GGDEF)-like protein